MKFYHGTSEKAWTKIKKEGVLWGIGRNYRHTYLTPKLEIAKRMGRGNVLLEVEYDPIGIDGQGIDNYGFNPPPGQICWQFAVFVPIPINQVKKIM